MQEYYIFISIFQIFALKFGYFDLIREIIYDARKTKMDDRGYVFLAKFTLEVGKFVDLGRFFGGWDIGTARKYISANWTAAALFSAIYAGAHFDDYKAAISAIWPRELLISIDLIAFTPEDTGIVFRTQASLSAMASRGSTS